MYSLKTANRWAKKSCPKWNKNRISRRFYRRLYRKLSQKYCNSVNGRNDIIYYKFGPRDINTYPWPYRDEGFADWEEDGSNENYNLISDQSGCVVKYSTSYCAYKIFESTGVWPQKTSPERLDANRWQQFLAEAGYTEIVKRPKFGNDYVGIKPNEGEWGLVVWVDDVCQEVITVSTYINKKYTRRAIHNPKEYIWVKIK